MDGNLLLAKYFSYTLDTEMLVKKEDNKRFTMRDIFIRKKIKNVEYYTQFHY